MLMQMDVIRKVFGNILHFQSKIEILMNLIGDLNVSISKRDFRPSYQGLWVGLVPYGDVGADSFGAWRRTPNGYQIKTEASQFTLPDTSWFFGPQLLTGWELVERKGSLCLVRFVSKPLATVCAPSGNNRRDIKLWHDYSWRTPLIVIKNMWDGLPINKEMLVNDAIFEISQQRVLHKTRAIFGFTSHVQQVKELFKQDPNWKCLVRSFPDLSTRILNDTALGSYFAFLPKEHYDLRHLLQGFGKKAREHGQMKRDFSVVTSIRSWIDLVIGFLLIMILFAMGIIPNFGMVLVFFLLFALFLWSFHWILSFVRKRRTLKFDVWKESQFQKEPEKCDREALDCTLISPASCWIPRQDRPLVGPAPAICEYLDIQGNWEQKNTGNVGTYFGFWLTNVPLRQPARTERNLAGALLHRILKAPPMPPDEQELIWDDLRKELDMPFNDPIIWRDWLEAWQDHYTDSRKKKLVAGTLVKIAQGQLTEHSPLVVDLFVKTDEHLVDHDPVKRFKPRTIHNVPTWVQCYVGPEVEACTRRIKEIFNGEDLVCWPNTNTYFRYGSGASDIQLTRWRMEVEELRDTKRDWAYVIASGDDVIAWNSTMYGDFEFDASSFDQSQSIGPLAYEWEVLKRLGMSSRARKLLSRTAYATLIACWKEDTPCKIGRLYRPFRDTGGPNTTLGNTIVMGAATCYAMTCSPENPLAYYEKLGFAMKGGLRKLGVGSFLKGLFYPLRDGGYAWGPAPSLFLKVGKMRSNPLEVYKHLKTKDYRKAVDFHLSCLAHSYAQSLQVPLLRVFVRRCLSGGSALEREFYKIQFSGALSNVRIDEEATHRVLYERYGIEPEELDMVEGWIKRGPFHFMEHPLFWKLADQDY
jgi:hypothetical protein